MAVFELTNDENVLFNHAAKFARGRSLHMQSNIQSVRTRHKDGSTSTYAVDAQRRFTVPDSDERAIRHLEADPRFSRIS